MQLNSKPGQRLIALTHTLEASVMAENWLEVTQLLAARQELIDGQSLSEELYNEISAIDERMLDELRKRLTGVKTDLRNLSTALRIASPYSRQEGPGSISLAS